jgi:syntaxin 16
MEGEEHLSLYQQDVLKKEAMQYDQEIDKLTEGMTNIHSLFKQMNEMVMQQGEMVDRIDVNIDQALKAVSKGKKNLVEAKEYQENGCARWCIRCEISAIIFLSLVIFLQYR